MCCRKNCWCEVMHDDGLSELRVFLRRTTYFFAECTELYNIEYPHVIICLVSQELFLTFIIISPFCNKKNPWLVVQPDDLNDDRLRASILALCKNRFLCNYEIIRSGKNLNLADLYQYVYFRSNNGLMNHFD